MSAIQNEKIVSSKIRNTSFRLSIFSFPIIFLLLLCSLFLSCASKQLLSRKEKKTLHQSIQDSPIFSKNYTGFALYDPAAKEMLYAFDADKYFTPASNTKLFTIYTALQILGDSLPALRYKITGDSLIFFGTGDPSLLHPHLPKSDRVIQFLKNRPEQLFYSPDNFNDERFGAGWAWDDYNYYYQVEKSAMPIYGNVITIKREKNTLTDTISPNYFKPLINYNSGIVRSRPRFKRAEASNQINLEGVLRSDKDFYQELPFKYQDSLLIHLLEAATDREIGLLSANPAEAKQIIYSIATDSAYQMVLEDSDNFIAEQLLLLCANELYDTMNVRRVIRYASDSLLQDLPDPLQWRDGSGLSRYNLFTPRSIVRLLEKIYEQISLDRIQVLFPEGGESGTIKQYYGSENSPFVYAKTGSLSNRHCLSGYVLTKSGKVLIFSFMHNNFYGSNVPFKEEMEKVLRWIYEEA